MSVLVATTQTEIVPSLGTVWTDVSFGGPTSITINSTGIWRIGAFLQIDADTALTAGAMGAFAFGIRFLADGATVLGISYFNNVGKFNDPSFALEPIGVKAYVKKRLASGASVKCQVGQYTVGGSSVHHVLAGSQFSAILQKSVV